MNQGDTDNGRSPAPQGRAGALRAEPAAQSQAKPLVPNAETRMAAYRAAYEAANGKPVSIRYADGYYYVRGSGNSGGFEAPYRGRQIDLFTGNLRTRAAQAIEARRAATGTGAVEDESAVGNADAPNPQRGNHG